MKMKKYVRIISVLMLLAALLAAVTACAPQKANNPYSVATELGYDGSLGSWMSELNGQSSEARKLYEEAKEDGYEGNFVDFLKEIGGVADPTAATSRALLSTVMVVCSFYKETDRSPIFGSVLEQYSCIGAGVIYSLDKSAGSAYIVTNYHVVYSGASAGKEPIPHICNEISLYLYGSEVSERAISASFVGGAMDYDIAVLKVTDSETIKECAAFAAAPGDSDKIVPGEQVYAVGNPDAAGFSVTTGVISVDAEYIDIKTADNSKTVSMLEIRTDTPINHGNSGGGLFNSDGKVVGIVNARSEESGVNGFGYAIPVNLAFAIAQNIIDNSAANNSHGAMRAMLGVTVKVVDSQSVYDEASSRVYVMESVAIQDAPVGGVAFGKLHSGDILYSVRVNGGEEYILTRMYMLTNFMFNIRKGDSVELVVSRNGEIVTVNFEFNSDSDFTLYS